MISTSEKLAQNLEKYLISPENWTEEILSNFPYDVREELKSKQPTGVGFRDDVGWFCLGAGQGPFIIWMQNP